MQVDIQRLTINTRGASEYPGSKQEQKVAYNCAQTFKDFEKDWMSRLFFIHNIQSWDKISEWRDKCLNSRANRDKLQTVSEDELN